MFQRKVSGRGTDVRLGSLIGALIALFAIADKGVAQTTTPAPDPTEPLRRYPISFLVKRPSIGPEPVSLLRVDAIHPGDDLEMNVNPELARNWTFVSATIATGQRIVLKSWNLWEKPYSEGPVEIGKVPKGDVVTLFFLVMNPKRESKVPDAVHNAVDHYAGQLISQTASFDTIYQQQNRLLNFMSAYAALGPKQNADLTFMKYRIALIDADLGMSYNPDAPQTQPGVLQHGLDAGLGILATLRQEPDNPGALAEMAQQQLPGVVSDWVGLVGDLMRIFIKPPHPVKLSFIPASGCDVYSDFAKTQANPDAWMQLMTERVLDTSTDTLAALVFRPNYVADPKPMPHPLEFASPQYLCDPNRAELLLGPNSRDLYLHPWSWDWECSEDGKTYKPIADAQLIPGRGLVFSLNDAFWHGQTQRDLFIRARIGFDKTKPVQLKVAKVFSQTWVTQDPANSDLAVGDHDATLHLTRNGAAQAFYRVADVALIDSAGHAIPATKSSYGADLAASFDLSAAVPGVAKLRVNEEGSTVPDTSATVIVESRHPAISLYCGRGDKEVRVAGAEAGWVKSLKVNNLFVTETDDSDPTNRRLTFSGPLPESVKSVDVTYRDPTTSIEWTRTVPISVGLPRPHVTAKITGTLPNVQQIGIGTDATATLPNGWFATAQPVRMKLEALKPYSWTHDIKLELGIGSEGDVQSIAQLSEGASFSLDANSKDAYVTLTLDSNLPANPKRTSGLIWFRLTRTDLSSPWILATATGAPMRSVKLPQVVAVDSSLAKTVVTLSKADDVLGVKFTGQSDFVAPQLVKGDPSTGLVATVEGPPGATEFDVQVRDSGESLIHVKLGKASKTPDTPVPASTDKPVAGTKPSPGTKPTPSPSKTPDKPAVTHTELPIFVHI